MVKMNSIFSDVIVDEAIRGEIYSSERLEKYALYLGENLKFTSERNKKNQLIPSVDRNYLLLSEIYKILIKKSQKGDELPTGGAWIVENFHIIEEQVREIKQDLPKSFYYELPWLQEGDLIGYPRIYALALSFIAHQDSHLSCNAMERYLNAFQQVSSLQMREVWAFVIFLRIVLLENLRRLAVESLYVYDVQNHTRKDLEMLTDEMISFEQYFKNIEERLGICRRIDCACVAGMAKTIRKVDLYDSEFHEKWQKFLKNRSFNHDELTHEDQKLQAATQVSIGNVITSMRLLSSIIWQEFFNKVSSLEKILLRDPASVYGKMDFDSKDQYRKVVENLSKSTHISELDIAERVVELCISNQCKKKSDKHIGFYLMGEGRSDLDRILGHKLLLNEKIIRIIKKNAGIFYFVMLMTFLLTLLLPVIFYFFQYNKNFLIIITWSFILLFPLSDTALSFVNIVISLFFKPNRLPKLELKDGIPDNAKTFVVIPTLISDKDSIDALFANLERHYLGNLDDKLYFALLTDFPDSDREDLPIDKALIKYGEDYAKSLNEKYKHNFRRKFFFFHRRRCWCESENKWMGWERKRGKLEEFNSLLRGNKNTSFITNSEGLESLFFSIRYIITLDSDTQMPRDCARKLIGTMLHPLNQPEIDKKRKTVCSGYTILQPRISITPESFRRSRFSEIFSGRVGIDPYTTAVSDSYMDLFGEGIFTGKGIYDVDAFIATLDGKIPENIVLSHDLLEGLFVRTALVTDVEFFDDHPSHYGAYSKRMHRWIRGDWQLISWLLPYIPNKKGEKTRNPLSLISRWKIFDNLRRSLVPPFLLLSLVSSWVFFPGNSLIWTVLILFLLFFPPYIRVGKELLLKPKGISFSNHVKNVFSSFKISCVQILVSITFLPHQTFVHLDAILRSLYRIFISKKKTLQWVCAAELELDAIRDKNNFLNLFVPVEVITFLILGIYLWPGKENSIFVFLFIGIWLVSPWIISQLSKIKESKAYVLSGEDILYLKTVARKTWHFFHTFLRKEDNYLMPDNFQEDPKEVVAHRTSPTNIGGQLLSCNIAYQLGFINICELENLLSNTLSTMVKMEKAHGHFYNWYDTRTLKPLLPYYISTVDSGNLAGHLIAIKQACLAIQEDKFLDEKLYEGIKVQLYMIRSDINNFLTDEVPALAPLFKQLSTWIDELFLKLEKTDISRISHWRNLLDCLLVKCQKIKNVCKAEHSLFDENSKYEFLIWTHELLILSKKTNTLIDHFAPWTLVSRIPKDLAFELDQVNLSSKKLSTILKSGKINDVHLIRLLHDTIQFRNNLKRKFQNIAESFYGLAINMNFSVLYNKERKVFVIGYNLSEGRLDTAFYDLLASEARLASFVAIAKGDVPTDHWFHLGRQMTSIRGKRTLISWSASMFEYLMPLLVMKDYDFTLLNETYTTAVNAQIRYGRDQKLPWGISESAYNIRDLDFNYQYGPFGIPGMGLKYLSYNEKVISPYSSGLAALINPKAAIKNFKLLAKEGAFTKYGFYEAIDYTGLRLLQNQKKVIIKSFMAHHQSMILGALGNILCKNILQKYFHQDPIVQATSLLLQERIPINVNMSKNRIQEMEKISDEMSRENLIRRFKTPITRIPEVQILSNGDYTVLITAAGCGFSNYKNLAMTRWQVDAALENQGHFFYLHDFNTGSTFSPTYMPLPTKYDHYEVAFSENKAEFWTEVQKLRTHMEVIVSEENNVEMRQITITNSSDQVRKISITSYLEPVLFPANDDNAHPAFSKMFLETKLISDRNAILVKRRKRGKDGKEDWLFHMFVGGNLKQNSIEYETDRKKFIGRCNDIRCPEAIVQNKKLSNTFGYVLDPICSIRAISTIKPFSTIKMCYSTGYASSYDEALNIIDQHYDVYSFERENEISWIQARAEMKQLNLTHKDLIIFQKLASLIFFPSLTLRSSKQMDMYNSLQQSKLWKFGISGDLPILLIKLSSNKDVSNLSTLLSAHEYLRINGVYFELIVIGQESVSYRMDIHDEVMHRLHSSGASHFLNKPAGIFYFNISDLNEEDLSLFEFVARIDFEANSESISDQLDQISGGRNLIKPSLIMRNENRLKMKTHDKFQYPLKFEFFNGYGGFANDGRDYHVFLHEDQNTPAPWINVLSNGENFGSIISEIGSSNTWSKNSREFRLTPWYNDPVVSQGGEAIYLYEKESNSSWSATPWPIRHNGLYEIIHGKGYSSFQHEFNDLFHDLTVFVPLNASLKIAKLKIRNLINKKRNLSLTFFIEWVMGFDRSKTAHYVKTWELGDTGTILAQNSFDNEFNNLIGFACTNREVESYTCDRHEFLGRLGSYRLPLGITSKKLSCKSGVGYDPCAAIRSNIILDELAEKEVIFILGQAESEDEVLKLQSEYLNSFSVQKALEEVKKYWEKQTQTIQIKTPNREFDILMNSWLSYQTLGCRIWARTAFYQSGGAYGFRDQLQDSLSLIHSSPELVREHILRAAAHQFEKGDVQHWWHPPTDRGVRTHFSDDLLWMVYATCYYIEVTGDMDILNEQVHFLKGPEVPEDKEDLYFTPTYSEQKANIYEHCIRAIERSLKTGAHELPLMGCGDWNDGMNRVGIDGKGESVWVGQFLIKILQDFIKFCDYFNDSEKVQIFESHKAKLLGAIEANAWDGNWYRRAFFDNGEALGSVENLECKIDSLAQSWSVIMGQGDKERQALAMQSVDRFLIKRESDIVLLFTPPFNHSTNDPGYIKGYPPGIRENGAQYTHAATWVAKAFISLGDGDRAFDVLKMLCPITHASTFSKIKKYQVEPYVIAADVYSVGDNLGKGGWSWYTGAAGWYYQVGLELLGLIRSGEWLYLRPCPPKSWEEYSMTFNYENTKYEIIVNQYFGASEEKLIVNLDGNEVSKNKIQLKANDIDHQVTVSLYWP